MSDARRALLSGLFDHAPTFPPALLPAAEALAADRLARAGEHAWLLGRLVWPAARVGEVPADEGRALALVEPGVERHDEVVYLEGVPLDEVAARGARAKVRCGGETVPPVGQLAGFVRGCRERGLVFKATAGLHHAYPTWAGGAGGRAAGARPEDRAGGAGAGAGEHGFLNLLAAAVFGDEEEALAAPARSFALDARSFRWNGREAGPDELAATRRDLFHSIGSCSFAEPVEELVALGVL